MIAKQILILLLFVSASFILIDFLPEKVSSVVWYSSAVILPLSFGLIFPFFRYFVGNKYLRINTEINTIDSYVNKEKETVYFYNSTYRINHEKYELKFELDYAKKVGSKAQIFVQRKDYNKARLTEDIYQSMVTSFVASIIMIPMMGYAIYLFRN